MEKKKRRIWQSVLRSFFMLFMCLSGGAGDVKKVMRQNNNGGFPASQAIQIVFWLLHMLATLSL